MSWTAEQVREAQALHRDGAPYSQIAEALGKSRSAVNGLFYRLKHGHGVGKCMTRKPPPKPAPFIVYKDLAPAKAPFAPDDSCPDFAWDEDHCAAVMAAGGYPAFRFGRAA